MGKVFAASLARLALLIPRSIKTTKGLNIAKRVADNVAFLYEGKIHEYGEAKELLENPKTHELRHFLQILEKTH